MMKASPMNHWLLKSEPTTYSIDDLKRDGRTCWEGVRNYQARNFMRDGIKVGDLALFYHSNAEPPGIAGVAKIVRAAYPDPESWNQKSKYYDAKAGSENPVWVMVDVGFVEKFPRLIPLEEIRRDKALTGMVLLQKGSRLSVQPVEKMHFERILKLGQRVMPVNG